MGSNETRKAFLRAAFRRRAAVVAAAAAAVFLVLMMPQTQTEAPRSVTTATYGACPDKIEVKRRGTTIVGKRPVLTGKVCAEAVDAGFCIDEPKKPLRCLPSFIVAGAQ